MRLIACLLLLTLPLTGCLDGDEETLRTLDVPTPRTPTYAGIQYACEGGDPVCVQRIMTDRNAAQRLGLFTVAQDPLDPDRVLVSAQEDDPDPYRTTEGVATRSTMWLIPSFDGGASWEPPAVFDPWDSTTVDRVEHTDHWTFPEVRWIDGQPTVLMGVGGYSLATHSAATSYEWSAFHPSLRGANSAKVASLPVDQEADAVATWHRPGAPLALAYMGLQSRDGVNVAWTDENATFGWRTARWDPESAPDLSAAWCDAVSMVDAPEPLVACTYWSESGAVPFGSVAPAGVLVLALTEEGLEPVHWSAPNDASCREVRVAKSGDRTVAVRGACGSRMLAEVFEPGRTDSVRNATLDVFGSGTDVRVLDVQAGPRGRVHVLAAGLANDGLDRTQAHAHVVIDPDDPEHPEIHALSRNDFGTTALTSTEAPASRFTWHDDGGRVYWWDGAGIASLPFAFVDDGTGPEAGQ